MIGLKFWRRGSLSAASKSPRKTSLGDNRQAAPAADHPATKPDKAPAEAAQADKS